MSGNLEGRWTVFVCTGCGEATGRHKDCDALREATPVVPCDEAAVERVALLLFARSFVPRVAVEQVRGMWEDAPDSTLEATREAAREVLRAAGEQP